MSLNIASRPRRARGRRSTRLPPRVARTSVDETSIIGSGTTWCGTFAICGSTARRRAGPVGDRQRHQRRAARASRARCAGSRTGPGRGSGTTRCRGSRGGELAHRVERVAGAAPAQLDAVEHEARLAGDRQPHHRLAVGGGGQRGASSARAGRPGSSAPRRAASCSSAACASATWALCTGSKLPPNRPMRFIRLTPALLAAQSRGAQEVAVQPRLGRARLGLPVVAPGHDRRHRHQDALGAPARLQAEQRAAVEHQVELDVAAAPVGLEVALALAVRQCRGGAARSAGRPAGRRRRRRASARSRRRSRPRRSRRRRCRRCRAARCGA